MQVQHGMRYLAAVAATIALAAGCTDDGGPPHRPTLPPTEPPTSSSSSPSPSSSPSDADTLSIEVWLTRDGKLFLTHRTVPRVAAIGTEALEALLAGPGREELLAGVSTAIPDGAVLSGLDVDVGFAHAEFTKHVESDPLAAAQVVYTLTQFPTVRRVLINDAEGGPLSRKDLEGQLPPIVVGSPPLGEEVSNPITVSGTADVFEAVVSIRVLDASGHQLARTTVTASCGSGCRGTYSKEVSYSIDERQPGVVVVYEVSEEDGKPIDPVRIPVVLTA